MTDVLRMPFFVKGELIDDMAVEHSSRDTGAAFLTPALDLDALFAQVQDLGEDLRDAGDVVRVGSFSSGNRVLGGELLAADRLFLRQVVVLDVHAELGELLEEGFAVLQLVKLDVLLELGRPLTVRPP